jgi:hypothetical protein
VDVLPFSASYPFLAASPPSIAATGQFPKKAEEGGADRGWPTPSLSGSNQVNILINSAEELEGNHYFYPFDNFVQLREVIAGPLSDVRRSSIQDALRRYEHPVTIIKARLAFRTFRVVRNRAVFRT